MQTNVSILWDIENVTPSMDTSFTDGLLDFAQKEGNISSLLAIGNWRKNLSNDLALSLSENGFELIHVPQPEKRGKAKKNSSDFALITRATEMVFQYPHIETYIILTGDIDFRALLQMLKKHGKRIVIICDVNNVAENLLEFADEYLDYRKLFSEEDSDEIEESGVPTNISKDVAFSLLSETVRSLMHEKKIPYSGGVKVRMKLLNENFSGDVKGFPSWKSFINDAVKNKIIGRNETEKGIVLTLPNENSEEIPVIFKSLLKVMSGLPKGSKWLSFSSVGKKLIANNVKIKDYNYSQLKKLVIDAEKRGFVKTKKENGLWYVAVC